MSLRNISSINAIIVIALCVAVFGHTASADEVYKANPNPPTNGLVGSNYTPAYAVNPVQFWHDFRPKIDTLINILSILYNTITNVLCPELC